MKQAVFLDRDGVINKMVYNPDFGLVDSPTRPTEFVFLPGVAEAVRQINQMGLLAIVISNQPGIAKGKFCRDLLDLVTAKLHRELNSVGAKLDGVYYCLHHPDAELEEYRVDCNCRKPKPGLLKQAARDWDIDLFNSYFVGDGITDMVAGQTVGTTCLYVGSRKEYILDEFHRKNVEPNYFVGGLLEATQIIRRIECKEQDMQGFTVKKTHRKLVSKPVFTRSISS